MKRRIFPFSILLTMLLFFTPLITSAATFTDVPKTYWANESITNLSDRGIIDGFRDGTFKPGVNVTRAQAAKIIAKALNIKPSPDFKPAFIDVSPSHFAYEEICALAERGVIANSTHFYPDNPLTRAEMTKIISNGFNIITDNNHYVYFSDVPKTSAWHNYIITLAAIDISKGISPTRFEPQGNVTRAQLAAFTGRALEFDLKREKGVIYFDKARKMYVDSSKPEPLPEVIDIDLTAAETAILVNEERKKRSLRPLDLDIELSQIAQKKAQEMADKGYFDHTSPTYGSPWDMAKYFNYEYKLLGENIAWNYSSPTTVIEGWMNSDGHRANIVNNGYTNIGVGYAVNKKGETYWVHFFARK